MVKIPYYGSPYLDLESWTIDNIDTKNASRGMQRRYNLLLL